MPELFLVAGAGVVAWVETSAPLVHEALKYKIAAGLIGLPFFVLCGIAWRIRSGRKAAATAAKQTPASSGYSYSRTDRGRRP